MRILVTNDDGIDSVGLHVLARAMRPYGDVVVIAPDAEYSGASAAFGALHTIQPEVCRRQLDGIDETWAVTGPPALCVMFARLGAFGPPFDLIVSGINPGANVGRSVYHSGTVGATLTGRNGGVSGVAVSQSVRELENVVERLVAELPTEPVVVNLNVPNVALDEIKGWRRTVVGTLPPRAMAAAVLEPKEGHDGTFHVRMGWGDPVALPSETDGGAVELDEVSITFLGRLMEDESSTALPVVEAGLASLLDR